MEISLESSHISHPINSLNSPLPQCISHVKRILYFISKHRESSVVCSY